MRISKHHIMNSDLYLSSLADGSAFRVITTLAEPLEEPLKRAGFSHPPKAGDTLLPRIVGPVSRFNARGRWNVRRDLPKQSRYIRTVSWRWEQWAGRGRTEEREEFKDIYRDCYPRELIPPPSVELVLLRLGGQWSVTSPELKRASATTEHNKHCINLMLELFGVCDLVTEALRPIDVPVIRRANWRMLPPGEYPWNKLEAHIDAVIGARSEDTRRVIWDRQETVKSFNPDEIYVGEAGFDDYLAYVFRTRQIVVLESVRKDNAVYVFGMDWKRVSQLSKAEILRNGLQLARIVHARGWKAQLARLMARPRAA